MFLSEIAVRRPVFTAMVILALITFGFIGYSQLSIDLMPDVEFPFVTVQVVYPGASPETVEGEITEILEDEISTIEGIKTLQSWSAENVGIIFVEFELEYEIDQVVQDVRDKVSGSLQYLPEDIESPIVEKFDTGSMPILSYVVSADMPPADLAKFIDDRIKTPLQGVGGVGRVSILGAREREVKVWLNLDKMKSLGVGVDEVAYALQSKNVDIPGGRIETGRSEYTVKTKGELGSVEEFREIVIRYADGRPILLKNVARVDDSIEDRRTLARLNGKPAVGITITQQSGANTVDVADGCYEAVDEIRELLPEGVDVVLIVDSSTFIRDAISDLLQQIFLGGFIATMIVLVFLRNLRTTIIAAAAIPTSIIGTFAFMNAMGFTLNMVSLMALALSVGMLIDDAIVVIENVYRHIEMGKGPFKAALEATREVGLAVLATSMTIFAVFIPIAFMKGLIGRFFLQFGLSVVFAAAISLFTAFTLIPMLSSRFVVPSRNTGRIFNIFENFFKRLESSYSRALDWSLRHRGLVLVLAIGAFIGAMMLSPLIGAEFQPPYDDGKIGVSLEIEEGSSIAVMEEYVEKVEKIISEYPEVVNIFSTVGGGSTEDVNNASIFVGLTTRFERERDQFELIALIRDDLQGIPGLKTVVAGYDAGPGGGGQEIQYILTSPDIEQLQRIADAVTLKMTENPGLVDINTDFISGKPEVRVHIDRDKAEDLGIDIMNIASTINQLVSGETTITKYKEAGDQFDVKMRLTSEYRDTPNDILRLMVRAGDGSLVDLYSLARVETATGPSRINHFAKQREITILANMDGIPLGTGMEFVEEITNENMEPGVTTKWGGMGDIMVESFGYLFFALFLGIILIYMILAAQFENFIHPFVIMFSLPLAMIGAFPMLLMKGDTINMMSFIGIITLMGLVTKNAILLVDFTNQERARGTSTDAALKIAGPVRLRPILMTALSTMGGLIPAFLAMGSGGEFRSPMASAVVGGLITSTFLTLLVVPVVYSLVDGWLGWIFRKLGRERPSGGKQVEV